MNSDEADYFRVRERQERRAAKAAPSPSARRAHQELADCYAAIVIRLAGQDPVPALRRYALL